MILITGGAGFIGSNLQAALVRRGLETVVVDSLGSDGKWRNLAKHPPSRLLPPGEIDGFLDSRPPLEMVYHLGRHQRHDGDRWRPRLGDQCRAAAAHLALVRQPRRPPGLCLLGRHLRRRLGGLRRRPDTGGAGAAAPAQPVRLDQARLRPARRARHRGPAAASAAMGRAEVLQRLWPERVPQGRHDLGGEDQARRGGRRRPGPAVPVDRARSRRRRAAARLHLGRRRGRRDAVAARHAGGERPVQRRHRPGANLPRPRHAVCDAAGVPRKVEFIDMPAPLRGQYQSFTEAADRPAARRRLRRASSRRSRKASGATCRTIWRSPTATHDPGPAVPAVRPGHRADRAVRHPLVRAGLHRRAGARLAAAAASGAAGAGGGDAGAGRRLPDLGHARRRARRAAGLRAVLPAGRLSDASRR